MWQENAKHSKILLNNQSIKTELTYEVASRGFNFYLAMLAIALMAIGIIIGIVQS